MFTNKLSPELFCGCIRQSFRFVVRKFVSDEKHKIHKSLRMARQRAINGLSDYQNVLLP
jgi:hypothetical protein